MSANERLAHRIRTTFAARLTLQRNRLNLTQLQLANRCKWPHTVISQYECGRKLPSLTSVHLLADMLGCTIDYLVGRSDQP